MIANAGGREVARSRFDRVGHRPRNKCLRAPEVSQAFWRSRRHQPRRLVRHDHAHVRGCPAGPQMDATSPSRANRSDNVLITVSISSRLSPKVLRLYPHVRPLAKSLQPGSDGGAHLAPVRFSCVVVDQPVRFTDGFDKAETVCSRCLPADCIGFGVGPGCSRSWRMVATAIWLSVSPAVVPRCRHRPQTIRARPQLVRPRFARAQSLLRRAPAWLHPGRIHASRVDPSPTFKICTNSVPAAATV
jgi:hypothetical protein